MKLAYWPAGGEDTKYHWCPACERLHVIPPNRWARSGPDEAPTYTPSFLQYDAKKLGDTVFGNCHYFITNGTLQFCPDSWHGRSDVIPMPDIPEAVLAQFEDAIFKV